MKDRDWENWLTAREGTLFGDMKRKTMKSMNSPTAVKTNYQSKSSSNKNRIVGNTDTAYRPRTPEEIHYGQEDLISIIIFFGFLGLITYGWFTNPEIKLKWYWYFGVGVAFAFGIDWLLKNPFRFILTLIRLAIKLILYLALIVAIGSVLYYFFSK